MTICLKYLKKISLIAKIRFFWSPIFYFLVFFKIGSYPFFPKGWHESILFSAINEPTITPSDLIALIFGDIGIHTRAAVSANSLPLGVAVEVDAIFELN